MTLKRNEDIKQLNIDSFSCYLPPGILWCGCWGVDGPPEPQDPAGLSQPRS